jgi:HPt (histidine-containing phosphotransfer) domain-containing protein
MSAFDRFEVYKPTWDSQQFFQICGTDKGLAIELIDLYKQQFDSSMLKLTKAVKENDQPNAILFSHDIKGSSANLGCKGVSEKALELEKLARAGKLADMQPKLPELAAVQKKSTDIFEEVLEDFPEDDEYDDDDEDEEDDDEEDDE